MCSRALQIAPSQICGFSAAVATIIFGTMFSPGYAQEQRCLVPVTIEPAKPYTIKAFEIHNRGGMPDIKQLDATVNLIGDQDSKTFGLSYKGTIVPDVKMTGDEKLLIRLYTNCDNAVLSDKSIPVGITNIGNLGKGREASTSIATADVNALVPLNAIGCVVIGIE